MKHVLSAFVALLVASAVGVDGQPPAAAVVPSVDGGRSAFGLLDGPPPPDVSLFAVEADSLPREVTPPTTVTEIVREDPRLSPPTTAYNPPPPLPPNWLTDEQLYRLRACESTSNYGAHLVWGTQWESRARGAYQFEQPTWDGVAARHMPQLVGVPPHHAAPADQDHMARLLYSERGRQPWPVCGWRV